ncbi:MAG: hypothetical protein WB502_12595 [Thermoactinomyces sp.]
MSNSCGCRTRRKRVVLNPGCRQRKEVHLRRGESVLVKCCRHAEHTKTCFLDPGEAVKVRCGKSKAIVRCSRRIRRRNHICLKPGEAVLFRCRHC